MENSASALVDAPLNDDDLNELARALFEEDERMLPESRTWETLDNSDIAFYRNGVRSIFRRYGELRAPK
jgi:hypothetical protein